MSKELKQKFIESCEEIIRQQGGCSDVKCYFCPLSVDYRDSNEACGHYFKSQSQKVIFAKTWLDDNAMQIKPKVKVYFESEEEAREFINYFFISNTIHAEESAINQIIKDIKKAGHIRKNPVEEAEDMYNEWINHRFNTYDDLDKLLEKQHEAIQYLKNQLRDE